MKDREPRVVFAGATDPAVAVLLLGALPLLAAPSWPVGLAVMATLDLGLALAWAWDARRAADRLGTLEIGFRAPATLIAGRDAALAVELANPGPEPLELEGQPAWGNGLGPSAAPWAARVPAHGHAEVPFAIHPLVPGDHGHDRMVVRTTGPLGLARVDVSLRAPATVRVRQAAVAPPAAPARPPAPARDDGGRPLPQRAPEGETASIRAYQPGDPVRAIHWKATARRGRAVVREYEAERREHTWVVLECGRGMAATRDGLPVYRAALAGVVGLARRLVEAGEAVSVLAVDAKLRAAVEEVEAVGALAGLGRELAAVEPSALEPDLAVALERIGRSRRRGDRVLVVSARTGRSLRTGAAGRLIGLARRHRVGLLGISGEAGIEPAVASGRELYQAALDGLEALQAGHLERDLGRAGVAWAAVGPERVGPGLMELAGRTARPARGRRGGRGPRRPGRGRT